jgi:2-methylcitrate dehydratase PrpD
MHNTTPLNDTAPLNHSIAHFADALAIEQIPMVVQERAKRHILDGLGLGFASLQYEFAQRTIAGITALGGSGECSVLGQATGFDARDAALINAVLIHGLDFDDTHLSSIIHPTCTSLSTALALAEQEDASGSSTLVAFLLGAELGIRIGAVIDGGFHHVGFHATGVVSHFAAALTAGKLLQIQPDALISALGITGSTASGIQVFLEEGAWTKRLHPGWGSVAGITAARLAAHGFKGPSRPLEGQFGLIETHLQSHAQDAKLGALTRGLGRDWMFADTALKPYPVCHFIHGCADAAIALHADIGGAAIDRVEAFLPEPTLHIVAEPAEQKTNPSNEYECKFSAQYVIAACLLNGHFGLPDLQPDALNCTDIRSLTKQVTCFADPDSAFPTYFSGRVRVYLSDGRILDRHVRVNSGAGDQALSTDAVIEKFMASATLTISQDHAAEIVDATLNLERLPSTREFTALLRHR